jgi:ectoine hydroxylase-related dioxygenase (phytanoyl-CoA dioxygenase family)
MSPLNIFDKFLKKNKSNFDSELDNILRLKKPINKNWSNISTHEAWFDKEDALDVITNRFNNNEINSNDEEILRSWVIDGYIKVNNIIHNDDIDGVNYFINDLFLTDKPKNITFLGLDSRAMSHRELILLDYKKRIQFAKKSPWRIHELWSECQFAKNIFLNKRLVEIASLIFGRQAYPRSTINFLYGSRQELHQDMSVFHVFPGNYLIGVWIALEDIHADSGPLLFSPGSHRHERYLKFDNHPQTNLRTCALSEYQEYYKYTNKIADKYGIKPFLAKKGDIFMWHGMLVHGGSPVKNINLTRRSMVIHFLTDGVDQTRLIEGPFNWD